MIAPTTASWMSAPDMRSPSATRATRPDAALHTAYRTTDWETNAIGAAKVAMAAAEVDAPLVHVSSDAVFADRNGPWFEADPTCPLHDYGRSKAAAERALASACPSVVIVRTSLLYGSIDLAAS